MEDHFHMPSDDQPEPAIERRVLDALFAMGDDSLQVALRAQLDDDFRRLREAIGDRVKSARATHELKGLAATVGAHRLADMALRLEIATADLPIDARLIHVVPIRAEIDAVLASLAISAGDRLIA